MTQQALQVSAATLDQACREMVRLSRGVARWLMNQPAVGEESLTDWYLYRLSDRVARVRYQKFNRAEEGRATGADWEWWFLFTSSSIVLRVQAKKLVSGSDQYSALAYSNQHGLQIEMLIRAAHKRNFLPFYAFYCVQEIAQSVLCRASAPLDRGAVFLADAANLHRAFILGGRKPVHARDLVAQSNPASCVLCCPLTTQAVGADALRHYLRTFFPAAFMGEDGEDLPNRGLYEGDPPPHVQRLLTAERRIEPTDDQPPPDGIGALLLFDLRKTDE